MAKGNQSVDLKKSKKPNYVKKGKEMDEKMSRWDRGGDCIAPATKKYVPKKG